MLFDFSQLTVGQVITRIIYNLWIYEARVIELSDTEVTCMVAVDVHRTMKFNRQTGVDIMGPEYGLIVNAPPTEGLPYRDELRERLLREVDAGTLHQETNAALVLHLLQKS